jgi:hypothetical protein
MRTTIPLLTALLLAPLAELHAASDAKPAGIAPPGTVLHHSPAMLGRYIGSPSICVLTNGDYLAACRTFAATKEGYRG